MSVCCKPLSVCSPPTHAPRARNAATPETSNLTAPFPFIDDIQFAKTLSMIRIPDKSYANYPRGILQCIGSLRCESTSATTCQTSAQNESPRAFKPPPSRFCHLQVQEVTSDYNSTVRRISPIPALRHAYNPLTSVNSSCRIPATRAPLILAAACRRDHQGNPQPKGWRNDRGGAEMREDHYLIRMFTWSCNHNWNFGKLSDLL